MADNSKAVAAAYLAGAVSGDGWLTEKTLGLAANDREFVDAFARAVEHVFGRHATVRRDERRWRVAYSNATHRFSGLSGVMVKADDAMMRAWLRGLFDGDGNAQCIKLKKGEASYQRRIAIYKTSDAVISTAQHYLTLLGISTAKSVRGATTGHKGTKAVIELRVLRRGSMKLFVELIGSTIPRKQDTLRAIVETMQPDGWQARNRAKGLYHTGAVGAPQ